MACEEEYELLEQIGRGSYGKVYRAQHDSGEVHAIKVVELEAAEDDLDNIQQEIKMLQAFNCPQLTRYHGSFIVGSALWISMEYLEGGSLQELIKASKANLDEHTTQWVLREILKALVYLHSERKIHRDVKAGNILVAADGSVRLADFGESVQLTHSIAKRQTFAGSPYWMAPEVIMAQDTYNSKADIWSLAVTAIEMIKGRPPYSEMHPMKAVLCIPNNPPPTLGKDGHYSKHFHTFLEQCFQRDPNLRPSAQDLLKHPFMKAARPTDVLKKLLEARRAAKMMKSLFGGGDAGGLLNPAAPSQDATHKAKTTLPASAAAAIAAAQAAAGNDGNAPDLSFDPKTASVEWDFGDGDGDDEREGEEEGAGAGAGERDDRFVQAASRAAAGIEGFHSRSLKSPAGAAPAGNGGTGGVSPGTAGSPPSPGAVTPKARGGSGGMWLDHTPEAEKSQGAATLKGPPPMAERQRRRGKMTKVGHLLGIDDAAGAATIQAEMTMLARQQGEELVRRQKAGGLGGWPSPSSGASAHGKGGGRNLSGPSGVASSTPSSTAKTAPVTHASSLSSPPAAVTAGGGQADAGRSASMSGGIVHGTARENGGASSADGTGGGGAGRPHAASHDLAARDGSAPQEAAAGGRVGKEGSGSGGVERSERPKPDGSGQETGGDRGESQPSTANPRHLSSGSDSVRWPALPPVRWASDEDGHEPTRHQGDGGDGMMDMAGEAAVHGVDTKGAESSPPPPAPLRPRRSWEQDDVGDLVEDDSDTGIRTRVDGAAAVPVGGREEDRGAATKAGAGEANAGVRRGSEGVGGKGVVQAAADTKSRAEGGHMSLPPLSPAIALPAAAARTPESSAVDTSAPHIASQSSLPMPWGTCGFGNISESPSGGSVKSTAGVLGLGTSEASRDIRESGAVAGDDDWDSSVGSEAQGADAEKRGDLGDGEVAGGPAIVERVVNSDAEFTSSEHENPSPPGSEVPASPSSATRGSLDEDSAATPPAASENAATAGAVVPEDGTAVMAEDGEAVGAVAVPRDAGEEEDRLTAAFHAHLTPALCELWDATEEGSVQRQAVQDLAMALERLDGCGNGQLTLDFVGAVARSWPAGEASTADDAPPSTG
eukprot:g10695.t1